MENTVIQYNAEKYPNFKEFLWYEQHEAELLRRYLGRYLVIKDEQVIGDFSSRKIARQHTVPNHKPGTFIIHLCAKKNPSKMPRIRGHKLVIVDTQ